MSFHIDEIQDELLQALNNSSDRLEPVEQGTVLWVADSVAQISGLHSAMAGELLTFSDGTHGLVLNLKHDTIGAVILGSHQHIKQGSPVRRSGRVLDVPVGDALLGRVVNIFGDPIDGKGSVITSETRPIETEAPGVVSRTRVCQPLQTGLKSIDSMVPIGKGQRELIIGDRQTGKTSVALDAIINQRGKNVICIYVAIGQKESTVASVVQTLEKLDAMAHTIVVSCTAGESAAMQYIAPYSGCAMGEYFMYKGRDVLIVYDDLSKQANAYREISLLLKRPPGREAFPGDVFYLHSRLLERAAKLSEDEGGGSMTALPIIETQAGDVSAYIPTNVISITDGQIFLESGLFHAGFRPAINVGVSVSRVGGDAQTKAMRKISGRLRLDLAQFRELQSFAQFGGDIDSITQKKINRGKKTMEILKQKNGKPMDIADQCISIYCAVNGLLDQLDLKSISVFEKMLIKHIQSRYPTVYEAFVSKMELEPQIIQAIETAAAEIQAQLENRETN